MRVLVPGSDRHVAIMDRRGLREVAAVVVAAGRVLEVDGRRHDAGATVVLAMRDARAAVGSGRATWAG